MTTKQVDILTKLLIKFLLSFTTCLGYYSIRFYESPVGKPVKRKWPLLIVDNHLKKNCFKIRNLNRWMYFYSSYRFAPTLRCCQNKYVISHTPKTELPFNDVATVYTQISGIRTGVHREISRQIFFQGLC